MGERTVEDRRTSSFPRTSIPLFYSQKSGTASARWVWTWRHLTCAGAALLKSRLLVNPLSWPDRSSASRESELYGLDEPLD